MAGKTLKDLKDRVDIVKTTMLEKRLENTIINKYLMRVDEDIISNINSKSSTDHISIPTMQRFMELNPSYKEELEELYVSKMKGQKGYEQVDVATMVAQAALFDGLCFVYDSKKDEYTLATMNFELLYDLDVEYDMLKQVLTKNKGGIVKAYRIDVEYSNSAEEFTFKATNARDYDIDESKEDYAEDKRFFLIPYVYSYRFMKVVESALNKGYLLRVHQALNGVEKVRFVTKDKKILGDYCDIPEAVSFLEAKFFPLKGFFYAPVVGAPSTTAMVTNINIFDVFKLKIVSAKNLETYKVQKPNNPIRELLGENLVVRKLENMKVTDDSDFAYIINQLPYRNKYLASDIDSIDGKSISKYMHSITNSAVESVYKIVGVNKELDRRMKLFAKGSRSINGVELKNIESLLNNNICRFVIQKKDCKLSSIFCTNNKSILKYIYGEDYIKVYESFATKFYIFLNWYKEKVSLSSLDSASIGDELEYLGLPSDNETIKKVTDSFGIDGFYLGLDIAEDTVKGFMADKMGINLNRSKAQSSSKTDNVLVRTLTAYTDEEGKPVEFYKYLDKSKIVSGLVFSVV